MTTVVDIVKKDAIVHQIFLMQMNVTTFYVAHIKIKKIKLVF